MGCYAWYYNAGQGVYYWGKAFEMTCTYFAHEVSNIIGESLGPSDVSAANSKSEMDAVERRANRLIYID